jgi:hypothetical protein
MEIVDPRIDPALVPAGSRAVVIAEHQDEYQDLPSVRTPTGYVITRWHLSEEERTQVLAGEDLFVTLLSQGAINPLFCTIGPCDWNSGEPMGPRFLDEITTLQLRNRLVEQRLLDSTERVKALEQLAKLAYQLSTYAACAERTNTKEYLKHLYDLVELTQAAAKAAGIQEPPGTMQGARPRL